MDQVSYVESLPLGGFNYDNCVRNKALMEHAKSKGGAGEMKFTATGTTICGIVFKDGVALCADTRATGGSIVGDKNCEKIHYLAPNIRCCGAGTAADCDHVTEMIKRELELHRLNTRSENRVQMAAGRLATHAFSYGGHIGTHLIVGGVDVKGPQLIECSSDGVFKASPYASTGSGSLAAMAILEVGYKEDMNQEEATALVVAAIEAGIYHDLGSGSNVDVALIKRGKVEYLRNLKHDNFKVYSKPDGYQFREERVKVLETYVHPSANKGKDEEEKM
jgi:20S proteasome subunit beta 2